MKDETPVQKNYSAVPRPLYPDVKNCVEDLLKKKYLRKSTFPYSLPIVCVRKKHQTLRLCIDYRYLSKRSKPDRHSLPRIQESCDSLGGNSWFSVLDRGKAYDQGFMSENSQTLTIFITSGVFTNASGYRSVNATPQPHTRDSWKTVWTTWATKYVSRILMTWSYLAPRFRIMQTICGG